ncbi:MAG: M1 family metallopeptidase [Bacteroidota bacterium]
MKNKLLLFIFFISLSSGLLAQTGYWQQAVAYTMDIDMAVETHQFTGTQQLVYTNNSPDTLSKVFYHLYFNAFQPNSMMDVRSRTIDDPDRRVRDRIAKLSPEEIGYLHAKSLSQDGSPLTYEEVGTILEVQLSSPLLPNSSTTFEMSFEGQVPLQIRRSGRDNKEGIEFTMTQWYPKLCEYDQDGWHANPYVAREFHGVWGSYDVTLSLDADYVVGGTGVLQNPKKVGHGYAKGEGKVDKEGKLSWHFVADQVHDFAWAADPDYVHDIMQVPDGPLLHFFYQPSDDSLVAKWKKLQPYTVSLFEEMSATFGKYPFPQYSVIQGGDGGMEYPMCTMITGDRKFTSLLGVTVHEAIHSWFQGVLATNESLYSWMDEGFTTYATNMMEDILLEEGKMNPHMGNYNRYFSLVASGKEEPSTTHSDHYDTNNAYGTAAYSKGAIFLHQLSYIIGKEAFFKGMLRYFNTWKFKHPRPTDFKRVMEKESGLELDWYFEHWIGTTNTVDYAIESVVGKGNQTEVTLRREGNMPMPLDIIVELNGSQAVGYNIPLRMMRGERKNDSFFPGLKYQVLADWPWTHPTYTFTIDVPVASISQVVIDASQRMADIDFYNNSYPRVSIPGYKAP